MGKTNSRRLLCLILSLAMVFALAVAPAYAAEETNAETVDTEEPLTDTAAAADNTVSLTVVIAETETNEEIEAETEETTDAPDPAAESETEEPTDEPTETPTEEPTENPIETPTEEPTQTAVQALQAQIDALPTVDELAEMDLDGQNEVYTAFLAACEAYDALSEEEQAEVDDSALDTLADYFNGLITVVTDTFQIGDTIYASWSDAIAAAYDGDEIDLLRSVTYSSSSVLTVTAGKNVTLDLNGYTLSKTYSGTSTSSLITNNGTLTIIDSSTDQTGTISVIASNTSTISSATVYLAAIRNAGTLNLNGGTIKASTKSTSSKMKLWCVVNTTSGASTVLDGASVVVEKTSTYYTSYGIYNNADNTSIEIKSGSVSVSSPASASTAAVGTNTSCSSSSITMSGGELTVTCTRDSNIAVAYYGILAESGSTTITGGEITVSSKGGAYGVKANEDSPAEISNLTMSVSTDTTSSSASYCLTAYANIYSGTYTMEDTTSLSAAFGTGTTIYGGTYSENLDKTGFLADGYDITDNGDGTYTVSATTTDVASVTSGETVTKYTSLAEAFNAATAGNTVTLLANIEQAETLTVNTSGTVTLDLAGYTLTIGSTDNTTSVALTIGESTTVVIVDSSANTTGVVANYGTITVNGTLDARDLGYTTDASAAGGLLGQTSGKISIGENGTFIVPDVWNGMWYSSAWDPNWASATGSYTYGGTTYTGIFSSLAVGAKVYSFGVGYKCTTAFEQSSYDSNTTYWELSGTYLVEYYKTSRGGEKIDVDDATTWTYPEAVVDGTIFAGWYEDANYNKTCSTAKTSGVAYAKFVNIKYSADGGIIRYLGSALKMDTTANENYSTTSLRLGYDFILPTGCKIESWSWDWGTSEDELSSTLNGENKLTETDLGDDAPSYTAADFFRSNIVVTDISSSDYEVVIYAKASITYTTADGTPVSAARSDVQSASVKDVAALMKNSTDATEKAYAEGILVAINAATE